MLHCSSRLMEAQFCGFEWPILRHIVSLMINLLFDVVCVVLVAKSISAEHFPAQRDLIL